MSLRWKGIKYPTPFCFKWASRRTNIERRGHVCRQNDFDQDGGATFEFEDGFRVYESQNAVKFLSDEIRRSLIGKDHIPWAKRCPKADGSPREFKNYFTEERKKKKSKEIIRKAKEAGVKLVADKRLSTGVIPSEIHAALKYAAAMQGIRPCKWIEAAIREKLEKELLDPLSKNSMAMKDIGKTEIR